MIDLKVFEKFETEKNMLPFSSSKIKTWKNNPAQFLLTYIYGYPRTTNHAIERGNAVEFGLEHLFTKDANVEECIDKAKTYYKSATALLDGEDKQYDMIEPMVRQCFNVFVQDEWFMSFQSFQGRIDTNILGVPFYGFTDFVFEDDINSITIVDLKTKQKFMPTHDDILQMAIYGKAMKEKFMEKNIKVKLLICTPKRCEFIDYLPNPKYLKEIEMQLESCANFFDACNEIDDMKKIIVPKIDDWTWNNKELLEQRHEIWGI
tara:strand:+ start:82 stop:867 length:786 start_codon:yes stop_codon:yes gene_type:complete